MRLGRSLIHGAWLAAKSMWDAMSYLRLTYYVVRRTLTLPGL